MHDKDLLPCPECGSAAELRHDYFVGIDDMYSYVHCTDTHCTLYSHSPIFWNDTLENNNQHAASSWNERYADAWQESIENAAVARRVLRAPNPLLDERVAQPRSRKKHVV